jgi:NitT/TauT family transport system ATP-binding protein
MDGMIPTDEGQVLLSGRPLTESLNDVGFVFQDVGLFAWRNVLDNVALGLQARRVNKAERDKVAKEHLKAVGLEKWGHYFPYQLSGGMQQRVGLARALSTSPKVLLMDEPFGAVDAMTRHTLQVELARIWEQSRVTVVFVTHDVDEAIFLADRVIVMGEAKVIKSVDVDVPRPRWNEASRASARYVEIRAELIRTLEGGDTTGGGAQ